jgi:hypothetical protein
VPCPPVFSKSSATLRWAGGPASTGPSGCAAGCRRTEGEWRGLRGRYCTVDKSVREDNKSGEERGGEKSVEEEIRLELT